MHFLRDITENRMTDHKYNEDTGEEPGITDSIQ
jgi:hypothetical protein